MEDPATPSSRDPPTALSSPVAPTTHGVPFTSFERASSHVQGKYADAYAYAKRYGDAPLNAHVLGGDGRGRPGVPPSARSSEVVNAALRSLEAKRRSVELERDAWKEKFEQREMARRDEIGSSNHTRVKDVERVEYLGSPQPQSNTKTMAVDTSKNSQQASIPSPEKPDNSLGFTRTDLEHAVRRAEIAEFALRALEGAKITSMTSHPNNPTSPHASDILHLQTQLAALRAEHAMHITELNQSWAARVRVAVREAKTRDDEITRRETLEDNARGTTHATQTVDLLHTAEGGVCRNLRMGSRDASTSSAAEYPDLDTQLLKQKVKTLESVVAALTSTTRARRRPKKKKKNSSTSSVRRFYQGNTDRRASTQAMRVNGSRARRKKTSLSRASSLATGSDSESDYYSDIDDPDAPYVPQTMEPRKPWGSGFATGNADGQLGLSPIKATKVEREALEKTKHAKPPFAPVVVRNRQPLVSVSNVYVPRHGTGARPPFRVTAKQHTRVALPMAVSRTAGGFQYAGDKSSASNTTLLKLKLARVAQKRRGALVAAARAGSITESPGSSPWVSTQPSPAQSPARPLFRIGNGETGMNENTSKKQTENINPKNVASLRETFEATRLEYKELTRGMDEPGGATHVDSDALDDVITRLRDVSAAIAKHVKV
mgnify:FL=1